jgi:predicted PurR-regulated permease PerM
VILLLALIGLGLAAWWLYSGLLPVLLAFALAYACSPLVDRLERRGWSRAWAVTALLAGLSLALGLAVALLLPVLLRDAKDLAERLPHYASAALDRVLLLGQAWGLHLPGREALLQSLQARLQGLSGGLLSGGTDVAKRVWAQAGSLLSSTLNLALVPIFFFFLLRDLPALRHWAAGLVPPRHRSLARSLALEVDKAFSGYIRGQLTVALILAAVLATGLSLLGVRYGLVIGILAGLLNIIPYMGQAIGLGLALTMAVVDFDGWGRLLAVPLLFGAVNFIEGTFITPRVVGDQVGLSPLQAMLALMLGASAAGLLGMVLAIPVAGVAKTLLSDLGQLYRRSQLYQGPRAKRR